MKPERHSLFGRLAAALSLAGFAMTASAAETAEDYRFRVFLDGREIGFHQTRVAGNTARRIVTTEARFDVELLFLDLFSYEHRANEVWRQDCLAEVLSTTDDNGRAFFVKGMAVGDGFRIESQDGSSTLPSCIMTFAYWDKRILSQDRLLNTQTGEYVDVEVLPGGEETLVIADLRVPARRYVVEAEGRRLLLWYTVETGQWVALEARTADGRQVRYEKVSPVRLRSGDRVVSGTKHAPSWGK